jgi:predicted NUDIX family NTP pyrophosphohydrolase
MPSKRSSAGLLLFRSGSAGLEVLLVHPGGPFWVRKDDGAWSIPKGECTDGEDPIDAARREAAEELGVAVSGALIALTPRRQKSGKTVHAWAVRSDFDPAQLASNTFSLEWPPGSGRQQSFPEVDRAEWFPLPLAKRKILPGQAGFLDELDEVLTQHPAMYHSHRPPHP